MTMGEDYETHTGCSTDADNPLKNWTREEKYELLQALKAKGSHDIPGIQIYLPHKTVPDILRAIAFYSSKIVKSINEDQKKIKVKQDGIMKTSLPLSNWARLLIESIGFDELQTDIATALRIIADLEEIPDAVLTENVDIKKAYHRLANAVEGKELQDDKYISALISKTIVETALTSKAFIRSTTLQQVIQDILKSDKAVFPKVEVTTPEAAAIGHLCLQRNYNPLNISENYMKPTSH